MEKQKSQPDILFIPQRLQKKMTVLPILFTLKKDALIAALKKSSGRLFPL